MYLGVNVEGLEAYSLCGINEHFELVFNTVAAIQIVFQRPVNGWNL